MKAITLWQPYASLIACGVKRIETRSWPAPKSLIGQRIAIHAAARRPPKCEHCNGSGCGPGTASGAYVPCEWCGGDGIFWFHDYLSTDVPRGAVVASAVLTDCVPMVADYDDVCSAYSGPAALEVGELLVLYPRWDSGLDDEDLTDVSHQWPFGVFAPGRYAWMLDEIAPTTERCPRCWGVGKHHLELDRDPWPCSVCDGKGSCDPIPAKGRERVWEWTPSGGGQ